jgi:hypothetical protein
MSNAHALVDSIVKAKPPAAKGKYLETVTLSSTMGPGVRIDTSHIIEVAVKHDATFFVLRSRAAFSNKNVAGERRTANDKKG